MGSSSKHFELPGKVDSYLATLNRLYQKKGEPVLQQIVVNGSVSIHEEWDYNTWDGGTYGHAITLMLYEDNYLELMDDVDDLRNRIREDINKLNNTQNEHISEVFVEMEPTEGDQWRESSGVFRPRIAPKSLPSDALSRIWGDRHVRVFLSHRANFKVETSRLKASLAACGISSFVAHEDIQPTEEWMREIERALFSMDALVALLTDNFHDSDWTDQEVGVAIGRGVPLIAVRLGRDPYGLMGKAQGLSGCDWKHCQSMALRIFDVLHKRLPDKSRLFEAALSAYAGSESYEGSAWAIHNLLTKFEDLTQEQVGRVIESYSSNSQNKDSFKGMRFLEPLLEKWTGNRWTVKNNELVPAVEQIPVDDEIPF